MAYVRPVSKYGWYLKRRSYTVHMLQEITSFFIAIFALILLWCIAAVAGGPESYQAFLTSLTSPGMVLLLWVLTIVMFYHAYAWFSVTPKAMVIQKGEDFIPGSAIAGAHYGIWIVVTLVVLFLAGVF